MIESLKTQLTELAAARQEYEQKKAELDALTNAFNDLHAELISKVDELNTVKKTHEETCRNLGLVEYHATGEKKPIDGVEVKLWDVTLFDPIEALQWCRVNMPALLMLNDKAYDKVLRERANSKNLRDALPDMPGQVAEEPKTSLARDLSQYLVGTEKAAEDVSPS